MPDDPLVARSDALSLRLSSLTPPPADGLETRILQSIPQAFAPARGTWRVWSWVLALACGVLLAVIAVVVTARPRPVSAAQAIHEMARALQGRGVVLTSRAPNSTVKGPWEWVYALDGDDSATPVWAIRNHLTGRWELVSGWYGDQLTVYGPRTGILARSYAHDFEWADHGGGGAWQLVKLVEGRLADNPPPGLDLVGTGTLDGQRCRIVSWHFLPPELPEDRRRDVSGWTLWWVGKESHLPVAVCLYFAPIGDPPPSVAKAEALLQDPGSHAVRFAPAPPPDRAFFGLADLQAKTTRDLRASQDALLRSCLQTFQGEKVRLTLHRVQSRADGCVYLLMSAEAPEAPPECSCWLSETNVRVTIPVDRLRWDADRDTVEQYRREGKRAWEGEASGPIRSRRGVEYYVYPHVLFGKGQLRVFEVALVPVKLGAAPLAGDAARLALRFSVLPPPLGLVTDWNTWAEGRIQVETTIPAASLAEDEPPPGTALAPTWLCEPRSAQRLAPDVAENARKLREVGRARDALRCAQLAERLFAEEARTNPALRGNLVLGPLLMDIYADLGDADQVRREAEAYEKVLDTHPIFQHKGNEDMRERERRRIERVLAYAASLR